MNMSISNPRSNGRPIPRIAASSYLNTAPLIWSFIDGGRGTHATLLTDKAPAKCAGMLQEGEVHAALVPVIQYHRIDDVLIVPDVCVGSRNAVRSVVLATTKDDLREIRSVALDVSSRTSAALIRIIFREFIGSEPEFVDAAPDLKGMLQRCDAALLIGDPAMVFERDGLHVYDMATLWKQNTGLGFVFAMWMVRKGSDQLVKGVDFAAVRDEGIEHIPEIAAGYSKTLGLPVDQLESYLRENICFSLDEEMKEGLALYYRLALKHGLVSTLKPLEFAKSS
jgi:chorismate dehydratase